MPTYNKFIHSFYDYTGTLHEVSISKASVIDTYVIEKSSDTPITISHDCGGKNEWDKEIIQGQELTFNFLVPQADVAVLDTIFDSEYQDYMLEYRINTTMLIFKGWVKPENLYKEFNKSMPQVPIQLSATDGLADLKDVPFKDAPGNRYNGRMTIMQIIKLALRTVNIPLDFRVQLNTYEKNVMASTDCALDKVYVNMGLFYPVDDIADTTCDSCWDVIEKVLKDFNVKFNQEYGAYVIVNHHEESSYEYLIDYDSLAVTARNDKYNVFDINTRLFRERIEQQKIHPLKSIITVYKTVDVGGDVTGVDLTDWIHSWNLHFYSHSVSADGKILQLVSTDGTPGVNYIELASTFNVSKISDNDYIRIVFDYRISSVSSMSGTPSMLMQIQVQRPNGSWSGAIDAPLYVTQYDSWISFDSNQFNIFKITEEGDYNIRISFMATPNSMWNWSVAAFQVRNFYIPKFAEWQADAYGKNTTNYEQQFGQINIKGYEQLSEELPLGDGNAITELNAFVSYASLQYGVTKDWNSYGSTEGIAIIDMYTRNVLKNRSKYKNFLRCTIIDRDHSISINQIVTIGSFNYVFGSFNKNYRNGEIEAELVELVHLELSTYNPHEVVGLKSASIGGIPEQTNFADGYEQTGHGFVIGDVIAYSDDDVLFFLADLTNLDYRAIGVVSDVISDNRFNYISEGYLNHPDMTYVLGKYYFLDPENPGKLIDTPTLLEYALEHCIGMGTHRGFKVELDNVVGYYAPDNIYVAYASDNTGTDFTMTNDEDLAFMAILKSPVKIETPVASDFDGLWRSGGGDPTTETDPVFNTWLIEHPISDVFDMEFLDSEDITWDIDPVAKTIKAYTIGATGTFLDHDSNTITHVRGLIKEKSGDTLYTLTVIDGSISV
jgi:hypothetical protein